MTKDAKTAISRAFMEIYARKRFDQITVKELCEATPVARSTFYAHYRNVEEVRAEVGDRLIAGLVEAADGVSGGDLPSMDFGAFLDVALAYVESNWDDFRALLIVQPDGRFVRKWKSAIKVNFAKRYPKVSMMPNGDLLSEMMASAAIGAYEHWMRNPEGADLEDAKRLVNHVLSSAMEKS